MENENKYRNCPKCLDTFLIDETDWVEVQKYLICEYCVNTFLDDIREREDKDENFAAIKVNYCVNCGDETIRDELCEYCQDDYEYKLNKD